MLDPAPCARPHHPAQVKIACVSGCTCTEVVMDAKNKTPTSELATERMPISPHSQ